MNIPFTSRERDLFVARLADQFGLLFEEHRHRVLDAAVSQRMRRCGTESAAAYAQQIDNNADELDRLVDAATNNLSRFFRNPGQLSAIVDFVVPSLDKRTGPDGRQAEASLPEARRPESTRPLRIWVAGCATGEEPYTLAMVLSDQLPALQGFHISATDISTRALGVARQGSYPTKAVRGIPDGVRTRHFTEQGGHVLVSESIRHRVSFVRHNLIDPPPVREVDLILCRNVLTYLTPDARIQAVAHLRESISEGGFLFIGNSETLPRQSGFTVTRTPEARFYRRSCRSPR